MFILLKIIDGLNEWVGKVAAFLVFGPLFILVYETVVRYAFNAPTTWAHELSVYFTITLFMLTGGYTLLHKGHVNVDVIHNRLPVRMRAFVGLLTATLFFAFIGVLFVQGLAFSWDSVIMLENSGSPLYWPIYPVKLMLPIAAFLLLLQGLAKFIRDLISLLIGRPYEQ
jgi:TRAP-type mannitol/chloroaromatic compound transport system permease small subunit